MISNIIVALCILGWVGLVDRCLLPLEVLTGVVTTERSVKDQSLIPEHTWNVAGALLSSETWVWPGCWVWVGAKSVNASCTIAREEPDLDELWLPVSDIDATSGTVEINTVVAWLLHEDGASLILPLRPTVGVVIGTVGRLQVSALSGCVNEAIGFRVKCAQIDLLLVDSLKNVDLSISWPVFQTNSPICRPCAGSCRHVGDVGDEKTSVVSPLTLQTKGRAAESVEIQVFVGGVNSEIRSTAAFDLSQTKCLRVCRGFEVDESIGRVRASKEVELVHEC